MFTKENILKHTKILLFLLVFHFVGTTFIKYQLGVDMHLSFLNNNIINLWKDIYLVFIYILILIYGYKNGRLKLFKNSFSYILLTIVFISLFFSFINFHGFKSLILGIKYDLWFLFPIFFYLILDISKKDIEKFYKFILSLIKWIIVLSFLFAIIRFVFPQALFALGYGPIGDWKLGNYPPMLYKTGMNGVQRVSGIFSGPNHLAFFFIAFGPIIILSILNKKLHYIWGILYLILLFGSLSRSGILAFGLEIFLLSIFIFKYYKQFRRYIIALFSVGIIGLTTIGIYLYVSGKYHQIILRGASTKGHVDRAKQAINGIKQKPILGHGLGTAGPASHYTKTDIVPESWFLQIFYEIGILGGFVWFFFIFYLLYHLNKNKKIYYPYLQKADILNIGISIGILGLLFQGLVLHSFEDSMVVIPLFITIGLLLAYYKNNDTKN